MATNTKTSNLMLQINAGLLKTLTEDELSLVKTPTFALLLHKKYPNAPLSIKESQDLGLIVGNRKLSSMLQVPSTLFMDYINSLDPSVRNEIYKKDIYKEFFVNYASLMIKSTFKKEFINFIKQHQLTIEVNSIWLSTYKELKKEISESLKLTTNSELFLTSLSFKDISNIITNEDISFSQMVFE